MHAAPRRAPFALTLAPRGAVVYARHRMKKYIAALAIVGGLVVGGAGCREDAATETGTASDGTALRPTETVEGVWFLSFDLPKGWVMVPHYAENTEVPPTDREVTNQMSDVVLQNTEGVIDLDGNNVQEGAVTENYAYMRVFRMDRRTGVPDEATDIGEGFYKLEKELTLTYYYKGAAATYKFVVYWNNVEQSTIEAAVTSAKEVTNFSE